MAGVRVALDVDDLVEAYMGGKSIPELAKDFGASASTIRKRLIHSGVKLRGVKEATRMKWSKVPKREGHRRIEVDTGALVAAYLSGETEREVASRFGVSRTVARSRLKEAGVTRSNAEAARVRYRRMPPEKRQAVATAANAALRGSKQPESGRIARAITNQRSLRYVGRGEREFGEMLKARGFDPIPQQAAWVYNIDLAIHPVAVEIETANRVPLDKPHIREKAVELMKRGWFPVFVWTPRGTNLTAAAADYVVAFSQAIERNPPPRGQYRMIWGAGQMLTAGGFEGDDLTVIDPLVGTLNI